MELLAGIPSPSPTPNPVGDIFGKITPVGPGATVEPSVFLGNLIVFGIRAFLLIASLALLVYLFWGAFDWITSGGDKEKVSKAQAKLTNAVIGIVLFIVIFSIYSVIAGDVLGIIQRDPQGNWIFILPSLPQ